MWNGHDNDSDVVISAAFCELFTATNAIKALNQVGFEDNDVELFGVLAGHMPDLTHFLRQKGVPLEHALYYQACFEEGGLLVMVHARRSARQKTAVAVLKQLGGIFAPAQ